MYYTEREKMFDEFVERYAGMLSGRDVSELFNRLTDIMGTITEAARICGIERRTPYYWKPDEGPEVRLQTKKKVLKVLIERDFEFTLKFMIKRSTDASRDMLRTYLETIYERAMEPDIPDRDFKDLITEFRLSRIDYSELIDSALAEELSDMLVPLKGEATSRDIDFPPLPLSTMTAEEVVHYLPRLCRLVPSHIDDEALDSLSQEWNFPKELVKLASDLAPPLQLPPTEGGIIALGIPIRVLKRDETARLVDPSEIVGIKLEDATNEKISSMKQVFLDSEPAPMSTPFIV